VRVTLPGCERWEPSLDCRQCGACCRAAYDCVELAPRDVVRKRHPELVVLDGPYPQMKRSGDRCIALHGGFGETASDGARPLLPYTCRIYEDRPKSCQEFERHGEHCLTARRRVGLSLGA
jgi:Fe-S-cluster containining protein